MRDLKELYQILLDNYDAKQEYYKEYVGICAIIFNLELGGQINELEYRLLNKDFKTRRPKAFSKFWWNLSFNKNTNNLWWWNRNKWGNKQRKLFIKHIIDSL